MKKTILILLSVVMAAAMVLTLTACSTCDRLGHDWDDGVVKTPATCTENGQAVFTCNRCNKQETRPVQATGHDWGEPFENSEGKLVRECSKCDAVDEVGGTLPPVTECTHENVTPHEAVAPDCLHQGSLAYWYCADCQKYFADADCTEETTLADTVVAADPTAHNYEWKDEFIPDNCSEDGTVAHYECTVCHTNFDENKDVLDSVVIPAQHTIGQLQQATKGADCQTPGTVAHYECDKCGRWFADQQALTELTGAERDGEYGDHVYDERVSAVSATCGQDGVLAHDHCQVCQKWYNEAGEEIQEGDWIDPATGLHTFTGNWENKDAQNHQRKCDNCDEYEQEAHNWGTSVIAHDQDGHTVECADGCGATNTVSHDWKYTDITTDQHTKVCKIEACSESIVENHDFGTGAYGSDTRHDCVCGELLCKETVVSGSATFNPGSKYTANTVLTEVTETSDKNHTVTFVFDKGTNNNAPQYYVNGTAIRIYGSNTLTISVAGYRITNIVFTFGKDDGSDKVTIVADGGNWDGSTWTGDATSVKFTFEGSSGNRRVASIAVTYSYTQDLSEHNWEEERQEASCTEAGLLTKTCKRCGLVETEVIQPTGHVFEEQNHHQYVAPTCTSLGEVEYWQCTTCGKNFASSDKLETEEVTEFTIAMLNHEFDGQPWIRGEGEHVGQHYQQCKNCTVEDGRNYVACNTESWGYDDNNHWNVCSVCGYDYNEQQGRDDHKYDEATDQCVCGKNNPVHVHEWDEPVAEQAATCTDAGNPAYVHCKTCDNYYTDTDAQQQLREDELVIGALGHNVENAPYQKVDEALHGKYCDRCMQYVEQTEHTWKSPAVNKDSAQHTVTCNDCQYSKDVAHDFGADGSRHDCECGEAWCVQESPDSVELTITSLGYSGSGYQSNTDGVTVDGKATFKYEKLAKNGNSIQTNSNQSPTPNIWNSTPLGGRITNVTVVLGGSYSGNLLKLEFGTEEGKYSSSYTETITADKLSIAVQGDWQYIRITYAASSGMRLFASITIDYATVTENHAWRETGRTTGSCQDGTPDSVTYRCDRCGQEKTETEAVKHDIIPVDEVKATCTSTGTAAHYKCQVCNKTFRDENGDEEWTPDTLEALTHDVAYNTQGEQHQAYCTRGDYTGDWESHEATDWVVGDTEHYQICTVCGATFNQGAHSYTEEGNTKCKCGAEEGHTHSYVEDKWAGDETGHWRICDSCELPDLQTKTDHVYDEDDSMYEYTAENGSHWTLCTVCFEEVTHNKSSVHYVNNQESGHTIVCDVEGCHFTKDVDHTGMDDNICDDCEYEKKVATPTEVYTVVFNSTTNSGSISSYTNDWYVTCNGFRWNIANCNNNSNSWNFIKAGSKSAASVASITTDKAMPETITKIGLTIDAITASSINSIKLYVSSSSDFTGAVAEGTFNKATGTQEITISNPQPNLYYKIEIDCAKASSNGTITISGVSYWGY